MNIFHRAAAFTRVKQRVRQRNLIGEANLAYVQERSVLDRDLTDFIYTNCLKPTA
jgi:hypothetical protein